MHKCLVHNCNLVDLFTSSYCPDCEDISKEINFEDLLPNKKRIAIAKDVLKRVEAEKIQPIRGKFIHRYSTFSHNVPVEVCQACALGAILISCADKSKITIDVSKSLGGDPSSTRLNIHEALKPYFSSEQLDLIEIAFEGSSHREYISASAVLNTKIFSNSKDTLYKIMTNIIENDGVFIPLDCPLANDKENA